MRYRTLVADNARWDGLDLRAGDIIITTPPKCGTTWTQMLCALLIFDGPDFPAPLGTISPWVEMQSRPVRDLHALYAAQDHRRFLKSHTPLDGLPWRDDVFYVVVGRDPRDVAISMEHHMANMDMKRFLELRTQALDEDDSDDPPPSRPPPSPDPVERFRAFVETDAPWALAGVMDQMRQAWERRALPNVSLFHYADYRADLPGEITRLADAVDIPIRAQRAAQLAPFAGLDAMRARADDVVPSASLGTFRDNAAFLRAGATGEWQSRVTDTDRVRYDARVRELAPPDLARWMHEGRLASGIEPVTNR